jgi:hypothetical protein
MFELAISSSWVDYNISIAPIYFPFFWQIVCFSEKMSDLIFGHISHY